MSLSNLIRLPFKYPNVDVFTFGDSSLFGYDSFNHCLIVQSFIELNNSSIYHLHLSSSSSPISSIRQLILNCDQTILALISTRTIYLVYLPQLNHLKNSRLCPVHVLPSSKTDSNEINHCVIDFLWLSPCHFVVVNSIPSSSECHLYTIRRLKTNQIEYLQTFSVGSTTVGKGRHGGTPNKRISLRQPSNIVKLDFAQRKVNEVTFILLFAIKADGEIYLLEINQNQLFNNEKEISSEFLGPICLYPSTFDNYGVDYNHCQFHCLSSSHFPILIFTREKGDIDQCILLNPSIDQYSIYTIDSISFRQKTTPNSSTIQSIILDPIHSNRYYLYDSLFNVYSIEITWIDQIEQKSSRIQSSNMQHLIQSDYSIEQMGFIQTNNQGQWLAMITKTAINEQKELIFLRPNSVSYPNLTSGKSRSLIEPIQRNQSNLSSEFVHRIRSLLYHEQSLPHLISSSSTTTTNLSNEDFQKNLLNIIKFFIEQYLEKQDKVRIELENKQRYLSNFHQTQLIAKQELDRKFEQIKQTFQIFNEQFQQEYSRRKCLTSNVNDLLSVIEQHTPVISNAELLMEEQLERYQIQIHSLEEKLRLVDQFLVQQHSSDLTKQHPSGLTKQHIDPPSMETFRQFVQYHQNEINQMKEQLQTILHQD